MDALEDLRLEVVGLLYTLSSEQLKVVCEFLEIPQEDIEGKSRSFVIGQITQHIDKEEISELEDQGMSLFLSLRDKIAEVKTPLQVATTQVINALAASSTPPQPADSALSQVSGQDRLEKQLEALQLALQLSAQSQQHDGREQTQAQNTLQHHTPTQAPAPLLGVSPWHREFKISGQIGEPGQKDKLTFSSLAHQIEAGLNKRVPEYEIVHAVIKAIAPGMQLRSYLEGKTDLTLPVLRKILRSHYQEKGATELYKQLTSEAQNSKETPQTFLFRALDLRQKILFASQEAESSLRYDPVLVQNMFLHSVLTGLQNDNIRNDLKPYLQQAGVNDEVLLEKLNIACMTETERQSKKKEGTPQRPVGVHSAQSTDPSESSEKKGKAPENKNKLNLMDELKGIKADIALLKNLSTEVCQIRESIQNPQMTSTQNSATPGTLNSPAVCQFDYVPTGSWRDSGTRESMAFSQNMSTPSPHSSPAAYPYDHMPTGFWRDSGRGRGGTAQFQQGYAPQRYPLPSNRGRIRRCSRCQQSGSNDLCTHCYACGSSEHYFAGCRARGVNSTRTPLNERGLPPRDRE